MKFTLPITGIAAVFMNPSYPRIAGVEFEWHVCDVNPRWPFLGPRIIFREKHATKAAAMGACADIRASKESWA